MHGIIVGKCSVAWEKISESVSHFNDWQDWVLTFVSSKCLRRKAASRRSRKTFHVHSVRDIVLTLHPEHSVERCNAARIGALLGRLDGVRILHGHQKNICL